jgi:hypothetical protein
MYTWTGSKDLASDRMEIFVKISCTMDSRIVELIKGNAQFVATLTNCYKHSGNLCLLMNFGHLKVLGKSTCKKVSVKSAHLTAC